MENMEGISYGELSELSDLFEGRCEQLGIIWTDLDVRDEAYLDFCSQWEDGIEEPELRLCGYGYEFRG